MARSQYFYSKKRGEVTSYTVNDLEALAEHLQVSIVEDTLSGALCGWFDENERCVHVDERLSYRQRRCVLAHELWHAVFHHEPTVHAYACKDELRVRWLTARSLISVEEYKAVELMFEGESFLMAQELEVTLQVLQDFQSLLEEHPRLLESKVLCMPIVAA